MQFRVKAECRTRAWIESTGFLLWSTGKARSGPEVNLKCLLQLLSLRQVLTLNLELGDSASLAGRQALGIFLLLPLQPWDYRDYSPGITTVSGFLIFFIWVLAGESNSVPYTYMATHTFLTKPSLQLSPIFINVYWLYKLVSSIVTCMWRAQSDSFPFPFIHC